MKGGGERPWVFKGVTKKKSGNECLGCRKGNIRGRIKEGFLNDHDTTWGWEDCDIHT